MLQGGGGNGFQALYLSTDLAPTLIFFIFHSACHGSSTRWNILLEPPSDAVSGKWFPQERQRMGARTEKKGWEKRERRGLESRRMEGNLGKKGGGRRGTQRGKKNENECKVRRENFKRMRKKVELGSINREAPYYCF